MHSKNDNLGQKAINGTMWVFLERIALELFRFVTTIVLARILGPKEFGLVALTSIFLAISLTFIDSGFTKALIQKKDTTVTDETTIFHFNLLISLTFVLLINLFAGPISIYFNETRLESILRALSLTLIFFALRQIQQVVLTKSLNFKLQFKANVTGTLMSGALGIALAYLGFGVWALVIQSISDSAIKTLMFWKVSKWRPKGSFSKHSFNQLYKYGLNLFFNDLLKTATENMYGLLIGKHYSSYNLGLYDRGNKLASLIITNFQFSIQKVTFPLFSKFQDDHVALKKTVKKSLDLIMFLVIPSMTILAITAKPLTLVLLGEKWIDIVPYTQLFCIYWFFSSTGGVNNHLVLALGHSKLILRSSILIYGLQFLILIFTLKQGITWIIVGQTASMVCRQIILMYYSAKLIDFGFKDQLGILAKYAGITAVTILPTLLFVNKIESNILLILLQASLGAISYLILNFFVKSSSLVILINYGKKFIEKKQKIEKVSLL